MAFLESRRFDGSSKPKWRRASEESSLGKSIAPADSSVLSLWDPTAPADAFYLLIS